jgi:hypothetical protein
VSVARIGVLVVEILHEKGSNATDENHGGERKGN